MKSFDVFNEVLYLVNSIGHLSNLARRAINKLNIYTCIYVF